MSSKTMDDSKTDVINARRWKRYRVELRLKVRQPHSPEKPVIFAQGSDVSEGGMAAYIPTEFSVGEIIEVELILPYNNKAISLKAAVRNRNGFRYGLEYVLIGDDERAHLSRSLKALALVQ